MNLLMWHVLRPLCEKIKDKTREIPAIAMEIN